MNRRMILTAAMVTLALAGCSAQAAGPATVTVTPPAVTVTADPVMVTADPVTVTADPVTRVLTTTVTETEAPTSKRASSSANGDACKRFNNDLQEAGLRTVLDAAVKDGNVSTANLAIGLRDYTVTSPGTADGGLAQDLIKFTKAARDLKAESFTQYDDKTVQTLVESYYHTSQVCTMIGAWS